MTTHHSDSITSYFPDPDRWQRRQPSNSGFDQQKFEQAIEHASTSEIGWSYDLTRHLPNGSKHPNDRILGPIKDRGKPSGLVIRHGYIVGEYGDIDAPDVTFSATKSYIASIAGLAFDSGLIPDLDDYVSETIDDDGFTSIHNQSITWRQLLQQTSEWDGELFGLPDSIDRGRQVGTQTNGDIDRIRVGETGGKSRTLNKPGSFWEYNDVRVNRTALALMRLFGKPLPEVLAQHIMQFIGASGNWQWHGYDNSWVKINGKRMQSVSGGAHWGGGLWISSLDHARFGLLFLRRGIWLDKQLISTTWLNLMTEPCPIKPEYGFLWWLNRDKQISAIGSPRSFAAQGAGGNIVFIEPELDVVIVLRWCADTRAVIDQILSSRTD